ncbi:DUF2306 domain-containing protein [Cohnella candidum]|uniref:DUF2306 domain-containing protein n=1 Tax=Cohnella candidum TaxID=2674991 RepID=A0A3G3K4S0_9BACL|nr:DUF2306 domain-containing protein [Cohnella candidum]AYQ75057.1 DUF2306 domain-containing protein [Cohnella candidum]
MTNKKLLFPLLYVLVTLLSFYVVLQYLIYSPSDSGMVSAKMDDPSFPYRVWKIFFYPHILLGLAALLTGSYQLTKRSRRNPALHKRLGRIYGISIFLNVPVVPFIALYATGGTPSTVAFMVLDVLWLAMTAAGVRYILRKDVVRHRQWMLRSYAVTLVFVTFRIVLGIESLLTDAPSSVTFPVAVALSIVLNLAYAEFYMTKKSKKSPTPYINDKGRSAQNV